MRICAVGRKNEGLLLHKRRKGPIYSRLGISDSRIPNFQVCMVEGDAFGAFFFLELNTAKIFLCVQFHSDQFAAARLVSLPDGGSWMRLASLRALR